MARADAGNGREPFFACRVLFYFLFESGWCLVNAQLAMLFWSFAG